MNVIVIFFLLHFCNYRYYNDDLQGQSKAISDARQLEVARDFCYWNCARWLPSRDDCYFLLGHERNRLLLSKIKTLLSDILFLVTCIISIDTKIEILSFNQLKTIILDAVVNSDDMFQEKFNVRSLRDSNAEMMSALYLQVSIVSQALIFVTRSRSWCFVERPGLLLVSAFLIAQLVSSSPLCKLLSFLHL